jgi:hypothetical protein
MATMANWKAPPKGKIYEALSALGDGRVVMVGERTAQVTSSARDKTYTVEWSEDGEGITSNDNASHWQGYLGYPILAVLMLRGQLSYSPSVASLLAGVPWKRLNDEFRRDYDRAVEHVLEAIVKEGGGRQRVEAEVDRIMAQVVGLRLEKLLPGERPPETRGSSTQPGPS